MAQTQDKVADGVATEKQNAKLKHAEGGVTTRDNLLDEGAPMLQGDPSEPVGPEDALGVGSKRGDYRERLIAPGLGEPHTSEPIPADEQEPDGPTSRLVAQRPRADDIGDVKGKKGGVETPES